MKCEWKMYQNKQMMSLTLFFQEHLANKRLHMIEIAEQSELGMQIYNSGRNLEESLINAAKIYNAINRIEGKPMEECDIKPSLDYIKALDHRSRHIHHEKQMSNINEGVEFSTGRQENEEDNHEYNTLESNKSFKINNPESNKISKPQDDYLVKRKEKIIWK